jgi:flavodoxin
MKILICYGSETGYVESISKIIYKNIYIYEKKSLKKLNEVKIEEMEENDINIILISTTGDGEFPRNSKNFYKRLRKIKEKKKIKYILCGFGDTNYNNYCHSAKILKRRLKRLDCKEILEIEYIDQENDEKVEDLIKKIKIFIKNKDIEKKKNKIKSFFPNYSFQVKPHPS